MIPLPALGFVKRFWPLIAIAAVAAWGGIGWWGKAGVERDFAEYRGEQARLVALQQERIIEEQNRVAQKAREASDANQKAARAIRDRWAERLRQPAGAGGGSLSATPATTGGPDAACEDRLRGALRSLEAVHRAAGAVAEGFRDAELTAAQLSQLQAFCGR